jgi:hypothetical protein
LRTVPRLDTTSVDSRLAAWFMALYPPIDFWESQLRMHYNLTLLHLHRQGAQLSIPSHSHYSGKLCAGAADSILKIIDSIVRTNTIRKCYFTTLTAITAAAIHIMREIDLAIQHGSTLLAMQHQGRLEELCTVTQELAVYWPNAEAVLNLFQHLLERSKSCSQLQLGYSATIDSLGTSNTDPPPADWDVIFSTLHANVPEPDWSNLDPWLGL